MDCTNCIYNNDGDRNYDENLCSRAHHYFRTHPIEFAEKYLNIKLYPWQKIMLKYFLKGSKNINVKTASRYISRR